MQTIMGKRNKMEQPADKFDGITTTGECLALFDPENFDEENIPVLERALSLAKTTEECLKVRSFFKLSLYHHSIIDKPASEKALELAKTTDECLTIIDWSGAGFDLKDRTLRRALELSNGNEGRGKVLDVASRSPFNHHDLALLAASEIEKHK